jgi:hypothetical protein
VTLIERLEALTEPDRHTADEVLLACGWTQNRVTVDGPLRWYSPNEKSPCFELGDQPNPLESLDAALLLVPDWWRYDIYGGPDPFRKSGAQAILAISPDDGKTNPVVSYGATPAIALCIAALEARGVK